MDKYAKYVSAEEWIKQKVDEELRFFNKSDAFASNMQTLKLKLKEPNMLRFYTSQSLADILVKKIIVNGPATIVFWQDGTKTVVKCDENDTYDLEKAFAMAYLKYSFGIEGRYNDVVSRILNKVEVV